MVPFLCHPALIYSLMSDYQVTLVNNKMSEFFVKFYGPTESEWCHYFSFGVV